MIALVVAGLVLAFAAGFAVGAAITRASSRAPDVVPVVDSPRRLLSLELSSSSPTAIPHVTTQLCDDDAQPIDSERYILGGPVPQEKC